MSVPLLRWDVPGPYEVVFTTRDGGVSEGPFESLNLGRRTGDEVERVDENRRRLCAEVGAEEQDLTLGFQTHSTLVNRAEAGSRGAPGDGLWTEEPGIPMLALGADCSLIAMARTNGSEPALAVLHAGWRGLLDGIVESAAQVIGPGFAAVVGPTIGPCCYEVGDEVASPYRARFGDGIVNDRKLDLWTAAEQAALEAGASTVDRLDLCTRCRADLFFSERRTGRPRGNTGRPWPCPLSRSRRGLPASAKKSAPMSPSSRPRSTSPSTTWPHWPRLESTSWARTARRTSRLKHAAHGDRFRWHFIGHLQSRKTKVVNHICELVHSLDSESAARRLEIPALIQVNLAGEESKSGVPPEALPDLLALYPDVRGLSTMPPAADNPEESRPYFRKLRELAEEHGLTELSMGTSQDYAVAAEEGATMIRIGSVLYRG